MTSTAGDAHIWQVTTGDTPTAVCGYSPPTEDIVTGEGEDAVVVGQQVIHAAPTGVTCAECVTVSTPDPEPAE